MQFFLAVLLFWSVFCYNVKATDPVWNVLRQSDYDIKIEIARIDSFNTSYYKYLKLDAVPYNRTFRVLNASFEFVQNVDKCIVVEVQFYKFLSNEYRYFPIRFQFDFCTEYNQDSFGIKHLFARSSNFNPCFIKKDVPYHLINGLFDFSKWPPHIPFGRYSMHLHSMDKRNGNNMSDMITNGEIKEKPKNWRLY